MITFSEDGALVTTRQYARLLLEWLTAMASILVCTARIPCVVQNATLIYRRTGNLRAVQLLLGHTKIESTVRYLGFDVDDALAISEQVEV